MSAQGGLIEVGTDLEMNRPAGIITQRQVYRRPSAQGSGVYCAMDENGAVEIIGGPGAVPLAGGQLSVDVTFDSRTLTLTATTSGGTPATYAWTIRSFDNVTGEEDATFNGATNASTAVISTPGITNNVVGLAQVKVTDTNGRITYNQYLVRLEKTIA